MPENNWQVRWSPTLGELEATHQEIWGTADYTDPTKPTVFFGVYGLPDFYTLWRHKGKRAILWAGTDIIHFENGYWLDTEGKMRIHPIQLSSWIDTYCENYVENEVEQTALRNVGIRSRVIPSFLGDVKKFPLTYQWNRRPKLYTSVSGNNFAQYGWPEAERLAHMYPEIEFHLYGNTDPWYSTNPNVFIHGRVPKQQMNKEIMEMTGAIRLTQFDGFSEILAKSILWGQYPVSPYIKYPHIYSESNLEGWLTEVGKKVANTEGREYWLKNLNRYPWNQK